MKQLHNSDHEPNPFWELETDKKLSFGTKLLAATIVLGYYLTRDVVRYQKTGKRGIFLKVIDLIVIFLLLVMVLAVSQTF